MRLNKTSFCLVLCCLLVIYLVHRKRTSQLVNLKHIVNYALCAAEAGGNAILKSKYNLIIKNKGLTKEGVEDRVTSADLLSHCSMVKTLKSQFPSLNILSEESETVCLSNNEEDRCLKYEETINSLENEWVKSEHVTVWIDPLDATYEFTEKLYQYVTTMVCVALNGRPIIGVIHKPFNNKTSWAWKMKGKSEDLTSRVKEDNVKLKIAISRSHSGKIKEMLDTKLSEYELVIAAGAGYKSLQVAYGEVDAYLHSTSIKKWDICAGNAIIEALGGQMTDKENTNIDYSQKSNIINENGLVATLKDHSKFLSLF